MSAAKAKQKEPAFVAATLRWCNARRAEKKREPIKKLPKGWIGDGYSCPCGKATGLFVSSSTYREADAYYTSARDLPQQVQGFVEAFDCGKLPQYIQKERGR